MKTLAKTRLDPITITEARSQFPEMLKALTEENEQVVTKDNLPVLVVVSWKRFRALREMLALLSTKESLDALDRASQKAATRTDIMSAEEIRNKLSQVHELA